MAPEYILAQIKTAKAPPNTTHELVARPRIAAITTVMIV
jgi:hypothetical protein